MSSTRYIGCDTAIFGPKLYNAVFGERGLLGGASGFADFLVGSERRRCDHRG